MPAVDLGRIALHYDDTGTGTVPVLLLHELGGSSASFSALFPALAADRRVIAPDLRGAGRSEKPIGPFTITDIAEDILALLDALAVPQVDIIGAALGCYVGALLAGRHSARVRRLVLAAVAPEIGARVVNYLTERATLVRTQGMRAAVDASLNNAFPDAHAAVRAAHQPRWLANDPAGFAELSLALARHRVSPADWATIAQPTLVLSGAHDFVWPPEAGRAVAASIPGARFAVLETAGHFPHLQAPEILTELARAFLE